MTFRPRSEAAKAVARKLGLDPDHTTDLAFYYETSGLVRMIAIVERIVTEDEIKALGLGACDAE